jgi:hypothetical protein
MKYGIIQNDKKQQSLFWSETLQQWIEIEGQFDVVQVLTKLMRKGNKCDCLLEAIANEVEKKYT